MFVKCREITHALNSFYKMSVMFLNFHNISEFCSEFLDIPKVLEMLEIFEIRGLLGIF